jgi:hypothetical protein
MVQPCGSEWMLVTMINLVKFASLVTLSWIGTIDFPALWIGAKVSMRRTSSSTFELSQLLVNWLFWILELTSASCPTTRVDVVLHDLVDVPSWKMPKENALTYGKRSTRVECEGLNNDLR